MSDWKCVNVGVPQGSVLGPLLFNVFINDLYFIPISIQIFNYADDNTICYQDKDIGNLRDSNDSGTAINWFGENGLLANPNKFQAIVLGAQRNSLTYFVIDKHTIETNHEIKILGVHLDDQLNFNSHVSIMCKKAASQLSALRRISYYFSDKNRLIIYKSFMRSTFDYCPIVWIFCGKTNSNKLEKLQERALREIYNDTTPSYDCLLENAGLLPLRLYRIRCLLIEVFKCLNGKCPAYLNNMFEIKQSNYDMRSNIQLIQKPFKTMKYGYRSFQYFGSKVWNSLPTDIKRISNLNSFKQGVTQWLREGNFKDLL